MKTQNKILIFAATYNEAENISNFLSDIDTLNLKADLLIIDDNSPDHTWKIIQAYAKNKKYINLIIRDKKRGLDTAHKTAFKYCRDNNYHYLITLDADLSHDPKKIPEFVCELEKHIFVIGSRYMQGGRCDLSGLRLLLSYFGNKLIKFIFNIDCSEFTTSFRGFNIQELEFFDLNDVSSEGYSFFMETVYRIASLGIHVRQIPIHFKDREKGKSKIPKIEIFRTLKNILRLKIIEIFRP